MYARQLDYFISVAECLNFTQAAKHHFITQTAMSQHIRALESKLGFELFVRNNRSVQLTPAGQIFFQETKRMIAIFDEAIEKARHAASGIAGNLRIGFIDLPNKKRVLPALIQKFHRKYPSIALSFKTGNEEAIRHDLERGLLDIAFTTSFNLAATPPGLAYKPLYRDPICAVVHRDHPLASKVKIPPTALANDPFIALEMREYPDALERMIQFCEERGFTPNIVSRHEYAETVLLMVEAGIGVALLPRFLKHSSNNNLRFLDLTGKPDYVSFIFTWSTNCNNPAIPLFLKEMDSFTEEKVPSTKKQPKSTVAGKVILTNSLN
ncbi:MAG: transcriptional regulator AlsR family [Firmicutes bacterium]|nr:transcriptional regulator AlsR family [Bacillota bacterium]